MTASDLIANAYADLGVLGEGQTLDGEALTNAFRRLNQLLSSLGSEGFITYQYATPDQDLVLDDGYELMLQSNLAVLLAPQHGKEAPPTVKQTAMTTRRTLKRANVNTPIAQIDPRAVQWGGYGYNILNDTYDGGLLR